MNDDLLHSDVTDKIIKTFYDTYNQLGYGFLEKVYENALAIELAREGFEVAKQYPLSVYYDDILIGEYFADLLVDNKVIVELKAAETIVQAHVNQLQNYLRASEIEVGMLLNFGRTPEFKRKVFTNARKKRGKEATS